MNGKLIIVKPHHLKAAVNRMSNEEREAFRKQLVLVSDEHNDVHCVVDKLCRDRKRKRRSK